MSSSNVVEPVIDLTPSIRRKLVWDLLPCPDQPEYFEMYGLMAGSEEGDIVEHRASHARLKRIAACQPTAQLLSGMAGDIVGRCILDSQGVDTDDSLGEHQLAQFTKVAQASTLAVIAQLVDQGIIRIEGGTLRERLLD